VVVADREREIESCAPSSGELIVEPDFLAKGDWKMSASSCRELIGRKLIAPCQSAMRAAIILGRPMRSGTRSTASIGIVSAPRGLRMR
jgi:hypothetical protein